MLSESRGGHGAAERVGGADAPDARPNRHRASAVGRGRRGNRECIDERLEAHLRFREPRAHERIATSQGDGTSYRAASEL